MDFFTAFVFIIFPAFYKLKKYFIFSLKISPISSVGFLKDGGTDARKIKVATFLLPKYSDL